MNLDVAMGPMLCSGMVKFTFNHVVDKHIDLPFGPQSSYSAHTRPSRFWDAFSRQYIQFASKAQHDTAEFAEGVLDGLMEDCNRSAIPKVFKVVSS